MLLLSFLAATGILAAFVVRFVCAYRNTTDRNRSPIIATWSSLPLLASVPILHWFPILEQLIARWAHPVVGSFLYLFVLALLSLFLEWCWNNVFRLSQPILDRYALSLRTLHSDYQFHRELERE
jgi:tellurite resistance protein TehA-like permease